LTPDHFFFFLSFLPRSLDRSRPKGKKNFPSPTAHQSKSGQPHPTRRTPNSGKLLSFPNSPEVLLAPRELETSLISNSPSFSLLYGLRSLPVLPPYFFFPSSLLLLEPFLNPSHGFTGSQSKTAPRRIGNHRNGTKSVHGVPSRAQKPT
jgi:hypothetical protein